jgi:HAMP domain-containing protein
MAESDSNTQQRHNSLARRFNWLLAFFYLASLLLTVPTVYFTTKQQVLAQANRELELLVDMVRSIQGYVAADLRPYLLERGLFHSAGFSGIVATSLVAEKFKGYQPRYYIKNASDNPLNPDNRPQPFELRLLERFRTDRKLDGLTEAGVLDGRRLLVHAAPKTSKAGCLRCHGDPREAPAEITSQFGTEAGYHYVPGQVVGVSVVGVPMADVDAVAMQRSLTLAVALTVFFALVLLAVRLVVRHSVLIPISRLTERAHSVARGELEEPVEMKRRDEIGDLARSLELLRRSFRKAMQRMGH